MYLLKSIKKDFPIFDRRFNGKPLVYLDNSATTQCPKVVIHALTNYYSKYKANVHRGIYALSEESTNIYEKSRRYIANFIGATFNELAFVKNTTEAANLVAYSFVYSNLNKGDTLVVFEFEHHSNFLPWVRVAKNKNLNLKIIRMNKEGSFNLEELKKINFKFLAIQHSSNFLGTVHPLKEVVKIAKSKNAYVFVDGAQAVAHKGVNVKNLDVDFYAFSGHKIYGPFGIGALYIKNSILPKMQPYLLGGGIVENVTIKKFSFIKGPEVLEAGTPNVGGAYAFYKALEYFTNLGKKEIFKHEEKVLNYLLKNLLELSFVTVYGPKNSKNRLGLVSFTVKGVHPHDLATILDAEGIAIRTGHHCAMPAHTFLGISSSARASIGLYNNKDDIDKLILGLKKSYKLFNK